VLAVNLIEHLPDPRAGVESIARLCTRGSIVVVHLPVVENRLSNWIART
jgi:2-polyprenyl-3-methyl-5-hydroxy-6-metoxy-1,4-benzoquinol methylase